MTWYAISLIQSFVAVTVLFIDKIIVSKWTKNPYQSLTITGVFSLIPALIVYLIKGIDVSIYAIPCILLGMFYMGTFILYFKLMQKDDVSKFTPFTVVSNIFILILAVILLKENLRFLQYIGIIVITLGALLLSIENKGKLKWSSSIKLLLVYVIMLSFSVIANKYLLGLVDYWTLFFYESIGIFIASLPIIFYNFKGLLKTISEHGKKVVGFILISETLAMISLLLLLVAASLGPVSLVNAFGSLKLIIIFIASLILSFLFPQILKEDYSNKKIIIQKMVATILMVIGSFLIFIK
ncbi:EamA family transporter [bacterium]|jgi:uncharacterized membrane protein|nr:EamA family transporter [bacterium]